MTDGGFSIIPHWVVRDSDLDAHELLVYLAILNRANKYGIAWPSIATIVKESRTSESTVRRTIKRLERPRRNPQGPPDVCARRRRAATHTFYRPNEPAPRPRASETSS